MAFFSSKKKNKESSAEVKKVTKKSSVGTTDIAVNVSENLENVIVQPRITEKASFRTGGNVYTFEVAKDATKEKIKKAVKLIYKVTPESVNVAPIPSKRTFSRGKRGVKKGGKKAYVYLKAGDTIELI